MSAIQRLVRGSIDLHVHCGPDPSTERSVDALQAALQAQEAGMRAIVLKSHELPTAPVAHIVNQIAPDINVFGSICLNHAVGGLNPSALEASARLGAKVVWMPTFNSASEMGKQQRAEVGINILDAKGKLLPVIDGILEIARSYQMVLATGHLSAAETFALVDAAVRKGVTRIIITHPSSKIWGACLSLDEQRALAARGAFIEHCFSHTMPFVGGIPPKTMASEVRAVGAEHCVMSTDLGQAYNPVPAEGMRVMVATMFKSGLTEEEMGFLIKINPARLLGLN